MGLSMPTWIKDKAEENATATITVLFFSIYVLEKLMPGTFLAVISAFLGAFVLYLLQARSRSGQLPVALQRTLSIFGYEVETSDADDDEGEVVESFEDLQKIAAARTEAAEQEEEEDGLPLQDGFYPLVDDYDLIHIGAEGQSSEVIRDMSNSANWPPNFDSDSLSSAYGAKMLSEWMETLAGTDDAAEGGQGAPIQGASAEVSDPRNKARMDLMFRYLASVETGSPTQAGHAHATTQRQKLQRKLLQRTACLGPTKVDGSSEIAAISDIDAVTGQSESQLEDPANIEALLKELGEDPNKTGGPNSQPKAPAKAQGPSKRKKGYVQAQDRRKGAGMAPPHKEIPVPSSPSAAAPSLAITAATEVSLQLTVQEKVYSLEEALVAEVPDGRAQTGFEVVANRKARRKDRKDSSQPAEPLQQTPPKEPPRSPQPAAVSPKASAAVPKPTPKATANTARTAKAPWARTAELDSMATHTGVETVEIAAQAANSAEATNSSGNGTDKASPTSAEQREVVTSAVAPADSDLDETPALDPAEMSKQTQSRTSGHECELIEDKPCDHEETAEVEHHAAEAHGNGGGSQKAEPSAEAEAVEDSGDLAENDDEEEDDEDGDGEDWEWQCPDGFPLQAYVCEKPLLCGSCGEMQPEGTTVQLAEESGWAACEECIRIAFGQPVELVEPQDWTTSEQAPFGATDEEAVDPSRMSALEIATWFQDRGAETALRQCMMQILAAEVAASKTLSTQESLVPATS